MTQRLGGRRVAAVSVPAWERLIRIRFEDGLCLVVELMGKSSNLLLLDEANRILRFARSHRGTFRVPREGAAYEPPPVTSWGSVGDLDREAFERISRPSGGPAGLARRLIEAMPGLSLPLAREVEQLAAEGREPWDAFVELRRLASDGPWEPRLYSPSPPDSLSELTSLGARNLFSYVFPLSHASGLVATPMKSCSQAEEAADTLLARHMAWDGQRASIASLLRDERRRAEGLLAVLETELAEAEASATTDRRRGEMILAGLQGARREGSDLIVADPYDAASGPVRVPIDPRLGLPANAERYFKSARRADRARQIIPGRVARLRDRLARLREAEPRAEACSSRQDLDSLESRLHDEGLIRAVRKPGRTEAGRKPQYLPVRRYRTREGFTILVGRSGADNDLLTFKVAAPHDLWLHAAGWPGAHVIIRNPRRLTSLPDSTVREAAGVAAFFSRGKAERELDVHVAWRRHVRKGRGMSPGMVLLKRHTTIRAVPGLPASVDEIARPVD